MPTAVIVYFSAERRHSLCDLLAAALPNLEVLSVVDNFLAAVSTVNERQPELLLLDLDLPRDTSVNLLEAVDYQGFAALCFGLPTGPEAVRLRQTELPLISFPFERKQVVDSVERTIRWRSETEPAARLAAIIDVLDPVNELPRKIALPTLNGFMLYRFDELLRCESQRNYTVFHKLDGETIMVSKTMKEFEKVLTQNGFFRIHRSHMVNLDHIDKYIRGKGGEVVLSDGTTLDVARDRKEGLMALLTGP